MPAHGAQGKLRPIVKTENGIGLEIVECARFQHRARAGERFLGGLKDEHHAAGEFVALLGQHGGDAKRDRHMRVVPAGVHLAGNLRRERQTGRFAHRQRVHVGADRDGRSRLAAFQHGDDAGPANARAAGDCQPREELLHAFRGFVFVERKLRVLMDLAPQRDQFVGPAVGRRLDRLEQIHRGFHIRAPLVARRQHVEYRVRGPG